MKLKKIVVATDLSEESKRPFGPLTALAKEAGSEITLLYAIQTLTESLVGEGEGARISPPEYEVETKNAEVAMEAFADSMDVPTSQQVVTGTHVAKAIVNYAEAEEADLIAISTHGRSGFRRLALGSVAEQVLRRSSVPVLCFPQRDERSSSDIRFDHILLSTDLSPEALRPFEPVFALARSLGARITVLNVVPTLQAIPYGAALAPAISSPGHVAETNARSELLELCHPIGKDIMFDVEVVSHESPAKGIVEYATRHKVDLIAISSHGRTGFRRAAFGSVAEQVVRHSSVPVLSFHRT